MRSRPWTHYAAPAAFLVGATIAILLVRSAVSNDASPASTAVSIPSVPRKTVAEKPRPAPRTKPRTTAARFYTVVAGDTFEVIAQKTGVPAAKIQQLNPNVQSTALYIGQKLRIR